MLPTYLWSPKPCLVYNRNTDREGGDHSCALEDFLSHEKEDRPETGTSEAHVLEWGWRHEALEVGEAVSSKVLSAADAFDLTGKQMHTT